MCTDSDYTEDHAQQFCRNMDDAGLETYHYSGRWSWEGPAVNGSNIQDAMSATKVHCQYDSMGLGYVVYPRRSATLRQ